MMAKDTMSTDANASINSVDGVSTTIGSSSHLHQIQHIRKRDAITKASKAVTRPFRRASPSFTRFAELPTELRIQIWEESIEPRVHELHPCSHLYNSRMTFRSNASTTPSIFHVNRESRGVAREEYNLMEYTPGAPEGEAGIETSARAGKGILRFYFAPRVDTLLLNSLMGLFVMFSLLASENPDPDEEELTGGLGNAAADKKGVMRGWQKVAIDAERAQLITLLSGIAGRSPQPRFRELFPDLKELVIAFDYTKNGKTRFRTSVWPGENGTTLGPITNLAGVGHLNPDFAGAFEPLRGFLANDYGQSSTSNHVDDDGYEDGNEETDINSSQISASRKLTASIPSLSVAKVHRKRYIRGDLRYAFRWSCSLVGVRPRGIFRRL